MFAATTHAPWVGCSCWPDLELSPTNTAVSQRGGAGAQAKIGSLDCVLRWLRRPGDSEQGQNSRREVVAAIDDVGDDLVAALYQPTGI